MIKQDFHVALGIQILYGGLCILWNTIGLWQIQQGVQPIGPTASLTVILLIVALVAALVICWQCAYKVAYLCFSSLTGLLAANAIWAGVTGNPDLWPSGLWRIAGIAVNVLGVAGLVMVFRATIHQRGN